MNGFYDIGELIVILPQTPRKGLCITVLHNVRYCTFARKMFAKWALYL